MGSSAKAREVDKRKKAAIRNIISNTGRVFNILFMRDTSCHQVKTTS